MLAVGNTAAADYSYSQLIRHVYLLKESCCFKISAFETAALDLAGQFHRTIGLH
jgi:hypothetical protein